jgi:hypothetical protein
MPVENAYHWYADLLKSGKDIGDIPAANTEVLPKEVEQPSETSELSS